MKNNPSRLPIDTEDIIKKHPLDLGDFVCNVVDEAMAGVYVDIIPTQEGLSITAGHDICNSESYGKHFLEVDLETLIAGPLPDNPNDSRREKSEILFLADKLQALVEKLRSYEWEDD